MSATEAIGVNRFIGETRGATRIEYALLAALVSVVAIIALLAISGPKT